MTTGIVLVNHTSKNPVILQRAQSKGIQCVFGSYADAPPFDKTLYVQDGTILPFDLLPAAWNFLDRWHAAVPLWRYGVLAADLGGEDERAETQKIVGDLRVLLYAHELLFVRDCDEGRALLTTWAAEADKFKSADMRLAFLRAFSIVKPIMCVLPVSWLADVREASAQYTRSPEAGPNKSFQSVGLITFEVEPGRWVKIRPGDEERVREQFQQQKVRIKC